MLLNNDNYTLYFKDRKVKLGKLNYKLLLLFIENKNKYITLDEIIKFVYQNISASKYYIDAARRMIILSNSKTRPYFKIKSCPKKGYYLEIQPINQNWKKSFLKNHKETLLLSKKYDEIRKIKKEINIIKEKISNNIEK